MSTQLESEKSAQSILEQMILGVAHELNNPNTFVRMNALNIKKMLGLLGPCLDEYEKNHPGEKFGPYLLGELRDKMIQLNESTLGATVRIIAIADKLKECCSFVMTQSSDVSLVEVINSIATMHKFLIDTWGKLEFVYDPAASYVINCHRLQLEQSFSILLTNACDAISEKFGKTDVPQGKLTITLIASDQNVKAVFRDNGCGMEEETVKKIFAPYFTTKPQGVGDGLGLPLCKAVVDRHGGNIEVKSVKGEGTEFIITLPRG
jgi:two-component system NtrC family sensor kinase